MKQIYTFLTGFFLCSTVFSQEKIEMPPIAATRVLHHEYILHSIDSIGRLKSRYDNFLPITPSKELNADIDSAVRVTVTNMRGRNRAEYAIR